MYLEAKRKWNPSINFNYLLILFSAIKYYNKFVFKQKYVVPHFWFPPPSLLSQTVSVLQLFPPNVAKLNNSPKTLHKIIAKLPLWLFNQSVLCGSNSSLSWIVREVPNKDTKKSTSLEVSVLKWPLAVLENFDWWNLQQKVKSCGFLRISGR